MIQARSGPGPITVGADKNYDTDEWGKQVRACGVTPHVAQNDKNRSSAIDARTTRHAGYALSQKKRQRVEEIFGWMKTVALMRKVRHRGCKGGGVDVYLGCGSLQPGTHSELGRNDGMKSREKCVWKREKSSESHPKGRQEGARTARQGREMAFATKGIF